MNIGPRPLVALAIPNALLAILGSVFMVSAASVPDILPVSFAGIASAIAFATAWRIDPRLSNWTLWFFGFYFLLFPLGGIFGLIILGHDFFSFSPPTTFAARVSGDSTRLSYLISGFTASILGFLVSICPPRLTTVIPPHDELLVRIGTVLFLITLPASALHAMWEFNTFGGTEFYYFYSAERRIHESPIPFAVVWINFNKFGFWLFLSSRPNKKMFLWMSLLFLICSFMRSLVGARILFLVPLAVVVWYHALIYRAHASTIRTLLTLFFGALLYSIALTSYRSSETVNLLNVSMSHELVFSVSKAQYFLALFLDNVRLLEGTGAFWLAPITFPIRYVFYGSDSVIGQSILAASLRGDLNHVLSSSLNMGAYLSGKGLGTSLVAEAYQYGMLYMPALLAMFYIFYYWFFNSIGNSRALFFLSPMIFSHVIFSARSSMFPNTWEPLKFLVLFYAVIGACWLQRQVVWRIRRETPDGR